MSLQNSISGPGTLTFLQQMRFFFQPVELLDTWGQQYGDTFLVTAPKFPTVIYISNPKDIQEVFSASPDLFDSGKGNGVMRPLVGENSLLLLDGIYHQRQRKLLMPPFHGERMRDYGQTIYSITEQVITQWVINKPFLIRSSIQEISLRTILSAVFGLQEGQRFEQLRQLLSSLLDSIGSPVSSSLLIFRSLQRDLGTWSPWGRFLRRKQQIDQLIYSEIQQRRNQIDASSGDILTLLMAARDEVGQPMTDTELRDELMTLLIAGHETTVSALTWTLCWLNRLPKVQNKLLQELNTFNCNLDLEKISKLPYLTAVCQETLRIYPVAMFGFSRILRRPAHLIGHQLDAESVIIPCIYLAHQREDLYPEPKHFKPERFLERQFSPYEYLPFGGGNRRCIGMAFAQFQMKMVLATVLSHYQLALVDNRSVRPVRRGVTLAPAGNIRMVVTGKR